MRSLLTEAYECKASFDGNRLLDPFSTNVSLFQKNFVSDVSLKSYCRGPHLGKISHVRNLLRLIGLVIVEPPSFGCDACHILIKFIHDTLEIYGKE